MAPTPGQLVRVRERLCVVDSVHAAGLGESPLAVDSGTSQHLVSLTSLDDEGLGDELEVVWEIEPGARVLERASLPEVVGFDEPRRLHAFLDAVAWGAVSSADVRRLQAPFRSGITLEDY